MTSEDKCGIGAGLLALGLAAGVILLAQVLPEGRFFFHRELVKPEAIFDGILCALALPAGVYFFYQGAFARPEEPQE
jgi:hypothetical protein